MVPNSSTSFLARAFARSLILSLSLGVYRTHSLFISRYIPYLFAFSIFQRGIWWIFLFSSLIFFLGLLFFVDVTVFFLGSSSFPLLLLLLILSHNSIYFLHIRWTQIQRTQTLSRFRLYFCSPRNTPGISCNVSVCECGVSKKCVVTDVISLFTEIFRHAIMFVCLFVYCNRVRASKLVLYYVHSEFSLPSLLHSFFLSFVRLLALLIYQ